MRITPSAPTERERSHTLAAKAGRSIPSITPRRLSISRKSLPLPFSLEKGIPFRIIAPSVSQDIGPSYQMPPARANPASLLPPPAGQEERRGPLRAEDVPDRLALPHDLEPVPGHHHLRRARPRVVVGGHGKP